MRLENTTGYFVPKGYPAVADYCIVGQLASICAKLQVTYHVGITASAPGFYGAQSRTVEPFRPRFDLVKKLRRLNVLNFEMEISTLFVLSSIAGWRAGAICTVFANRELDTFIAPSKKANAERTALLAALEAIASLK
jgi:uridine phosphorylase